MIKINNLYFSYVKNEYAIKDLNLDIPKGQFLTILGHNGSGKSTLSKLLVGLLMPDSGEIYVDNIKLSGDTLNDVRKKIGIVFQNPDNQFVGVTVAHDIAFGLENRRVPREEMLELVDKYIKKVDMSEFYKTEPQKLSGGQKQRVAIAGVLALNTDVIIFDESTSMLDPEGTLEIIELIKGLKGNKTIISITHDMDFAKISDRIVVLNEGKLILDGTPEEVFSKTDLLKLAKLDIPFNLKLYNEALKNNLRKEVLDALWELNLRK